MIARRLISALAALALCLALPLGSSAAPEPYTIDVIANMTGVNAYVGQTETDALKVFEKYQNARGGINGRPLKFVYYDDQTDPKIALQLASQLLAKKPIVIFGSGQTQDVRCDGAVDGQWTRDVLLHAGVRSKER